jgi:hypothetical protein
MVKSRKVLVIAFAGALWAREQTVLDDFAKRADEYVKLRRKLDDELTRLKPTRSAEAIAIHQQELARRIAGARAAATQGDIFTPAVGAEFRRLIALTMQGHRAKRIRRSLASAEPVELPLRVNDPYPNRVPLQSTPPSLLLNLPKLPKELDYRVVGHNLVLRDTEANMIVDFIPNAMR